MMWGRNTATLPIDRKLLETTRDIVRIDDRLEYFDAGGQPNQEWAGPTEQSGLLGFRIDEEGTIEIGNRAINVSRKASTNSGTRDKARPVSS